MLDGFDSDISLFVVGDISRRKVRLVYWRGLRVPTQAVSQSPLTPLIALLETI